MNDYLFGVYKHLMGQKRDQRARRHVSIKKKSVTGNARCPLYDTPWMTQQRKVTGRRIKINAANSPRPSNTKATASYDRWLWRVALKGTDGFQIFDPMTSSFNDVTCLFVGYLLASAIPPQVRRPPSCTILPICSLQCNKWINK